MNCYHPPQLFLFQHLISDSAPPHHMGWHRIFLFSACNALMCMSVCLFMLVRIVCTYTEEHLFELFGRHGEINSVKVMDDLNLHASFYLFSSFYSSFFFRFHLLSLHICYCTCSSIPSLPISTFPNTTHLHSIRSMVEICDHHGEK